MNKEAKMSTFEKTFLAALLGAGSYAGFRTFRDFANAVDQKDDEETETLRVTIPAARMPDFNPMQKLSEENKNLFLTRDAVQKALSIAAPIAAVPASFMLAQKIDTLYRQAQLDEEKKRVEEEYLQQLAKMSAWETPTVDRFVEGLVTALDKKAAELSKTATEPTDIKATSFPAGQGVMHGANETLRAAGRFVKDTTKGARENILNPAIVLLALTGGLGVYGLHNYQEAKKEEEEQKKKLPTTIELDVV